CYTYNWMPDGEVLKKKFRTPMNEEPLKLIPRAWRSKIVADLGVTDKGFTIPEFGELNPACRFIFKAMMQKYDGDFSQVMKHIRVQRLIFSEKDRVGIGTFQPKDEKNQDSTELTGDINYRKIAEYGSDSDPRAFNFDGEFNIA